MKSLSKNILKILTFLFFVGISFSIYVLVSLILSRGYLTGARGTDTLAFISRLKFLADFFPNYPVWTPREGAGISAIYSYPILIHTFVIFITKITSLNLAESVKLIGFLSVPTFGLGLFTYVFFRFKKLVTAFLAGLFYVISPIAWIFLFEWGFYAESVAAIFFPLTILFYELHIDGLIKADKSIKNRIIFFVIPILLAISLLSHPTIFTAEVSYFAFYPLISSIFLASESRMKFFGKVALKSVILIILGVGVASFWFIPFNEYLKISALNSPGAGVINPNSMISGLHEVEIKFKEVFSFSVVTDESNRRFNFRTLSFPLGISILYFVGLVLPFLTKKKEQMTSFLSSFIVTLIATNTYFIILMALTPIPFMSQMASWRSLIYSARMFVPVVAAFSLYNFFELLVFFIKPKNWILKFSKEIIISVFVLAGAVGILFYFSNKPAILKKNIVYGEGVSTNDYWATKKDNICGLKDTTDETRCKSATFIKNISVMDFRNECNNLALVVGLDNLPNLCANNLPIDNEVESFLNDCKNQVNNNWNKTICKSIYEPFIKQLTDKNGWLKVYNLFWETDENNFVGSFRKTFDQIPDDDFTRYDVSPNNVGFSIVGPIAKSTPMLSTYFSASSLINRYWGFQLSNFYTNDPVYADGYALSDLAKWFGVKYVISGKPDPLEKFSMSGFVNKDTNYPIYEFDNDQKTIEISKKPKILVIGDDSKRVYDIVLKLSPFGLIPYDNQFLIHGKNYVDDYSLEDLKKYDLLLLYGQKYKNQNHSWKLIDDYVKNGGSIFIDTGWQYNSPEWQIGETPDFIPVTNLSWTNFGKTSDYQIGSDLIDNSKVDTSKFQPLVWNDLPWGVSSGDNLRAWAKNILTTNGHPLIAGGLYGKGKVVWSGMNIFGHIKGYDSKNDELEMTSNLIRWLVGNKEVKNYTFGQDFSAKRINPDKVTIEINNDIGESSLYFKEAYYPYWQAKLIAKNGKVFPISIMTAWPQLMLVELPPLSKGDKINFEIVKPFKFYFADAISIITLVIIIVYVFYPKLFIVKIPVKSKKIKETVNEETDY